MASRVVIIQRIVPHYRVEFFRRLQDTLSAADIELALWYGQEHHGTVPRTVNVSAPWAQRVQNRYFRIGTHELVWQPCWDEARNADLVIIEQANRLLLNHMLLLARRFSSRPQIAFWGHGRNFQSSDSETVKEKFKQLIAPRVDWWFAYTELSAQVAIAAGVPATRITVTNNAIDTTALSCALAAVTQRQKEELRNRLQIPDLAPVGIFCGGMHAGKELRFLIESCVRIRARIPNFHILFVGDGPCADEVQAAASRHRWMHYVGAAYGADRACLFSLADVMLMPAHVGLAILDSFVARTPLFTTDLNTHSPEIHYLQNGTNGIMSTFDVDDYADTVSAHLCAPERLERLRTGCEISAARYSLDEMVSRFAQGVRSCLLR